jgi:alpha-L-arabinofuranosidase
VNSNVIKISKLKDDWKKYTGRLKALRSVDSRLVITGDAPGTFFLDFVTLVPESSRLWKGGKYGPFRKDLMEALDNLHPRFMRFPGGCASEGTNYFGQVFWKNSVGRPEERLGFRNHWGYWTSQFVGFYEYFLMAESLGASPLPVLNNGVTCQFAGHQYIAPLETEADRQRFHDIFVKDALDLIEFCNGPASSTWGKVRAQMGHPAPFNLKYLGIGNENRGKEFWERFDIIYKAVKAQYPDIIIVTTAGARDAGREFDANYAEIDAKYADTYVDEHYYKGDDWFFNNGNRYDRNAVRGGQGMTYDRNRPTRVFVGEFANNGTNNAYRSTLAEAAYWLSLERNSDMVVLAAYVPLFCKKGFNKWNSNLIWFDNRGLWRTTNYYYQQLFSQGGDRAVKHVKQWGDADRNIYLSSTIDTRTGTIYLKFVNAEAKAKAIYVSMNNTSNYMAEMEYITSHDTDVKNQGGQNYYSSHPDVDSSFSYHEAITPQLQTIGPVKAMFEFTMPENSVGVLRLVKS